MTCIVLLLALPAFVAWGALARPKRQFTWAMFSRSTKAFLWVQDGRRYRALRHEEVSLAPDGHFLTLTDAYRLLSGRADVPPVRGFVIGHHGNWFLRYDTEVGKLAAGKVPSGTELAHLADVMRRLTC